MNCAIVASYARSFRWIVLFTAIVVGAKELAHLAFFDFFYVDPRRTRDGVILMMITVPPIAGVIAAIGSILVFTLPQVLQAALVASWYRKFGSRAHFAVLPALPLTAVLTWYCYDYLTPSDFAPGYVGPPSPPYRHGISIARYFGALQFQAPVTLFSFLYLDADFRGASRWPVLMATLMITIASGGIWGYVSAQEQIELWSSTRWPRNEAPLAALHLAIGSTRSTNPLASNRRAGNLIPNNIQPACQRDISHDEPGTERPDYPHRAQGALRKADADVLAAGGAGR